MQCMEVWGGNHRVDQGVVMPGLDVWVFSEPYHGDDLGGDVHYVSSCGTGRICRLIVADVSGHGSRVSEVARGLRTLMRRFVNYLDQSRFVEALNQGFLASDEDGLFATSVAMTFFSPSRQLDVCNAGHPRPLIRRARSGRWEFMSGPSEERSRTDLTNLPLGVLEPTAYEDYGVTLERDDLVLVYTDAVTEARAPDGTLLGEEGLLRLMKEIVATEPARLIPTVVAKLSVWRGGEQPDDDMTLLLLRHNGVASQAPYFERLWAPVRFFGIIGRAMMPFGERPPIPWPERSVPNIVGAFSTRVSRSWRGWRRRDATQR